MKPAPFEIARRNEVLARLRIAIEQRDPIPFDARPEAPYRGRVGDYEYVFEGEDDLLRLVVQREDGREMALEESKQVASFVLTGVPEAMVWLRPGAKAHHYYVGHDLL